MSVVWFVILCGVTGPLTKETQDLLLQEVAQQNQIAGQYVSDITTHSINVRRPHHRWGPVDNVFLCHVDLRTTSRYERWPIKAFLYHSSIGPVL